MTPTEIAAIEARVAAADGVRVRGWKKKAADVALVQVTGGPEQNIDPWIMQAVHAPTDLARLLADRRELEARATAAEAALADAVARKDGAYEERNRVVAALAAQYPAGTKRTSIEGWSEDWHGCVYIDTPERQLSWHYHDSQAHLFAHLPPYAGQWDGHNTPTKYERVARIAAAIREPKP